GGLSNVMVRIVNSVVTFTNVYFPNFDGTAVFTSALLGATPAPVITNADGGTFRIFANSAMTNLNGNVIPYFAYTITGPMGYFVSSPTDTNRVAGFEFNPTSYDDIVTNPPPAPLASIAISTSKPNVTWLAQPYMAYSVLFATNVQGPYAPLFTGLSFNSTN